MADDDACRGAFDKPLETWRKSCSAWAFVVLGLRELDASGSRGPQPVGLLKVRPRPNPPQPWITPHDRQRASAGSGPPSTRLIAVVDPRFDGRLSISRVW